MKLDNLLIIGGLAAIAYILLRKKKDNVVTPIDIVPQEVVPKNEPVVVDLSKSSTRRRGGLFPESIYRQYNASKMATVAPAKATIKTVEPVAQPIL